ncbi:MAG: thiol peroxidase [Gammaproteobacteria bacterium]|nr:thiol peroxidase [Gammaproteobacteria bacterium]MDH3372168.1 thiol peroxidase [Gammaproteobacteria bacterium]MDH3408860.1 thiol peroxidase [Gammaproteobacteria bacterium]MDH3551334.1 thiol peroxidase [Gammaproteobacteria bacterium]
MAIIKFEGGTYRTAGELPAVGSHAPDVSLVNTKLQNVSLANWTGMRKVMNIFVSIDTDVCAKSVIEFNRRARLADDVAMLMISYDLPFAHKRFLAEHKLDGVIGLSAIRHAGFGENYGVQIVDGPLAGMFARAVVVMDENNTVVHHEHIEDITTEPNYGSALRALGIKADED